MSWGLFAKDAKNAASRSALPRIQSRADYDRIPLRRYLQPAGRDDEALEQLKKVMELDPNQVVALASMVMIHADKGEIAQALRSRAAGGRPKSPRKHCSISTVEAQ